MGGYAQSHAATARTHDTNRCKLSPQQKKALAYHKDHPLEAEYPHAFRRHWPRQRAAANQAYRHRVRQMLGEYRGVIEEEHDRSASARVRAARRRFVRKWGGAPLSQVIQERQRRRVARAARQYFRDPYLAERDRQGFSTFLAALTSALAHQRGLARRFADLLTASRYVESDMPVYLRRAVRSTHSTWLRAFLRDEPEWEPRLRAWIARVLGEPAGGEAASEPIWGKARLTRAVVLEHTARGKRTVIYARQLLQAGVRAGGLCGDSPQPRFNRRALGRLAPRHHPTH